MSEPQTHHLSFSGPKMAFSSSQNTIRFKGKMANFEAKNTIKQGKKAKRTNGTHFTRVHPYDLLESIAEAYCRTKRRRIAVHIRLRSQQGTAMQIGGGVLRYKLEVRCSTY